MKRRPKTPKETVKSLKSKLDVVAEANFALHNRMNKIDRDVDGVRGAHQRLRKHVFAKPTAPASIRRAIATHMLAGMLASAPMTDRTKVNAKVWAAKAYEFADALIEGEAK